jgi:hypothetical protein
MLKTACLAVLLGLASFLFATDGKPGALSSVQGKFKVVFPHAVERLAQNASDHVPGESFASAGPEGATFVIWGDVVGKGAEKATPDQIAAAALGGMSRNGKSRLLSKEQVTFGGAKASHVFFQDQDSTTEGYLIVRSRRVYLIFGIARSSQALQDTAFRSFFSSFHLADGK